MREEDRRMVKVKGDQERHRSEREREKVVKQRGSRGA